MTTMRAAKEETIGKETITVTAGMKIEIKTTNAIRKRRKD